VLGRVSITEGKLTFFGANYTVNSGSIGFYNPVRIEPLLDLNLETKSKGVDVSLRVTGPIDNLKLSYTSDPPLQFEEILSLLAAGRVPTSDPTLLANQPSQPPQSYQQMGETALMGKALADPVANRLQRVFGVTQLKIDPTLTNGSQLPQAQLSLQQQVADNITFTYVTALDSANAQIISVEFALNRQWSATAMRDQNGIFSVNLIYKKQFR
jgi:translocation and assembly module TamB